MAMRKIFNIAHRVRKICEMVSRRKISLTYDFYAEPKLVCMCAVASTALSKIYEMEGIKNRFVIGKFGSDKDNHCWVELIDMEIIVDITVTQFGLKDKVYIVPSKNDLYMPIEFGQYKLDDWTETQRPDDRIVSSIIRDYYKI